MGLHINKSLVIVGMLCKHCTLDEKVFESIEGVWLYEFHLLAPLSTHHIIKYPPIDTQTGTHTDTHRQTHRQEQRTHTDGRTDSQTDGGRQARTHKHPEQHPSVSVDL